MLELYVRDCSAMLLDLCSKVRPPPRNSKILDGFWRAMFYPFGPVGRLWCTVPLPTAWSRHLLWAATRRTGRWPGVQERKTVTLEANPSEADGWQPDKWANAPAGGGTWRGCVPSHAQHRELPKHRRPNQQQPQTKHLQNSKNVDAVLRTVWELLASFDVRMEKNILAPIWAKLAILSLLKAPGSFSYASWGKVGGFWGQLGPSGGHVDAKLGYVMLCYGFRSNFLRACCWFCIPKCIPPNRTKTWSGFPRAMFAPFGYVGGIFGPTSAILGPTSAILGLCWRLYGIIWDNVTSAYSKTTPNYASKTLSPGALAA